MWLGMQEQIWPVLITWDKFIVYQNDNQWHILNILTTFIITKKPNRYITQSVDEQITIHSLVGVYR